jgi:hypothetical protein
MQFFSSSTPLPRISVHVGKILRLSGRDSEFQKISSTVRVDRNNDG